MAGLNFECAPIAEFRDDVFDDSATLEEQLGQVRDYIGTLSTWIQENRQLLKIAVQRVQEFEKLHKSEIDE